MKALVLVLAAFSGLAMAQSTKSISVQVNSNLSNFSIDQAVYSLVPTKTEFREITGCTVNDAVSSCREEVVLAREPMVEVYVNYNESVQSVAEGVQQFLKFQFKASDFSSAELAEIQAVSPMYKWDLHGVRRAFAQEKFALLAKQVKTTIQVVDMSKSKVCSWTEAGMESNCVEKIVYKTVPSTAQQVTLILK